MPPPIIASIFRFCRARMGWRQRGRAWMLGWLAVAVLALPLGATLHALAHVEAAMSAEHHGAQPPWGTEGPAGHCHGCSVWNALGGALPALPWAVTSVPPVHDFPLARVRPVAAAPISWFRPRAPPFIA